MLLPKTINELPVIPREDPRVMILPNQDIVSARRAKGYSTIVRMAMAERDVELPEVDDILQHLAEYDAELQKFSNSSKGAKGLDGKVIIPEHSWCLLPLRSYEQNLDGLAHLIPSGYYAGAEVSIVDGVPVCHYETDYTDIDGLDQPTLTALRISMRYTSEASRANEPVIGDTYPHQFMRPAELAVPSKLFYVDLDPLLTMPPLIAN